MGSFENSGGSSVVPQSCLYYYDDFFLFFFSRYVRLGPEFAGEFNSLPEYLTNEGRWPGFRIHERCHWRIMGPSARLGG